MMAAFIANAIRVRIDSGGTVRSHRHVKRMLAAAILGVAGNDLKGAFTNWDEGKGDDRIRRERNVGVEIKDLVIAVGYGKLVDVARRRVVARQLVHLHPV